jgi:hypothetical protein
MKKGCKKCGVELEPGVNIYPSSLKNWDYTCKECIKAKAISNNKKRKDKIKEENRRWNLENKDKRRKINKNWDKKVESGVYGIYHKEKLVYIGQSVHPIRRKSMHFSIFSDLDYAEKISPVAYNLAIGNYKKSDLTWKLLESVSDLDERLEIEKGYIEKYNPVLNDRIG